MSGLDPYHITNKLDDAVLDVIVTRLETRGKHPLFMGMLRDYLDCMEIEKAGKVLDVGCGTGVAARAIASTEGFSGAVLGIDLSAYLIEAAKGLFEDQGLGGEIDFQVGDTQSLDLEDQAFDAVVAHTLLSHVGDPLTVLREIKRVVKPGGFEQEDQEKTKAMCSGVLDKNIKHLAQALHFFV